MSEPSNPQEEPQTQEPSLGISRKNVVNITGGVETEGGRTLYGFDAEVYLRMKAKEDPELERKVGEWIEDIVGYEIEDTCNLWASLKSGKVLVEMINKICPNTVPRYNKKDQLHILMERENISLYLEGCWKLGLGADDMFIAPDLHSRNNITAVINNIIALSDIANYFGFVRVISLRTGEIPQENKHFINAANSTSQTPVDSPAGSPPASPQKKKPAKKWTVPIPTTTYVEQLAPDVDPEYVISQLRKDLEAANLKISQMEYSNGLLKDDLKAARRKNREENASSDNTDLLEEIRKLKIERLKLVGENERLKRNARTSGPAGPSSPQKEMIMACQELQRLIMNILNPALAVRKDHCLIFNEWFKTEDTMRRTFASVLRETLFEKNKGEEVEIDPVSFDALTYLIESLLDNSNPTNGADIISGKYILQCSYITYRKPSLFSKEWTHDFIQKHKFWTTSVFWQEYFWDKMARKFPDLSPDKNKSLVDELNFFAPTLILWGENTEETILDFFRDVFKKIDLGAAKMDDAAVTKMENDMVEVTKKQKNYIRSSTGLNIRNVLWGVAAQYIEAPIVDLKLEFSSCANTSIKSISSSDAKAEGAAKQDAAKPVKATPQPTAAMQAAKSVTPTPSTGNSNKAPIKTATPASKTQAAAPKLNSAPASKPASAAASPQQPRLADSTKAKEPAKVAVLNTAKAVAGTATPPKTESPPVSVSNSPRSGAATPAAVEEGEAPQKRMSVREKISAANAKNNAFLASSPGAAATLPVPIQPSAKK